MLPLCFLLCWWRKRSSGCGRKRLDKGTLRQDIKNQFLDKAQVESEQTALLTLGLHATVIVVLLDWGWAREIPEAKTGQNLTK